MISLIAHNLSSVMAGLVPAIHALAAKEDVDARHKAGHDDGKSEASGQP
jgi:hypothetical protein